MYVRGYLQGSENGREVTIEMSRWSPVYIPEIETGRHVKNNACSVEIKIKWVIRKHRRDDTYRFNFCFFFASIFGVMLYIYKAWQIN